MQNALTDLRYSWKSLPMALHFAWGDTKARYKRSVLGPWWIVLGTAIGGWQLARGALAALDAPPGSDAGLMRMQVVLARFYAEQILPRALVHGAAVRAGSATVMALAAEQF